MCHINNISLSRIRFFHQITFKSFFAICLELLLLLLFFLSTLCVFSLHFIYLRGSIVCWPHRTNTKIPHAHTAALNVFYQRKIALWQCWANDQHRTRKNKKNSMKHARLRSRRNWREDKTTQYMHMWMCGRSSACMCWCYNRYTEYVNVEKPFTIVEAKQWPNHLVHRQQIHHTYDQSQWSVYTHKYTLNRHILTHTTALQTT